MNPLFRLSERNRDLLLVFAGTLLFWLPFLFAVSGDPSFVMPIVDCQEFHDWALDILRRFPGGWEAMRTHPPLYPYFLAAVYRLFGVSSLVVGVIQHLLFAASAAMLYLAGEKLGGRRAALAACAIFDLYWFPLYMQSFLYSENLSLFLNLWVLCALLLAGDRWWKYPAAGIVLGLSAACRPEIAAFAPLSLPWFLRGENAPARPTRAYLSFLLGFALVIAPLVGHVYKISGRLTIRDYFGANLYLGNAPEFRGTLIFLETGKQWADFILAPARETGRKLSDGESDNYYVRKTLKVIAADPAGWLKLTASKTAAVWLGREFLRTEDVHVFDNYLAGRPYYRLLPLPVLMFFALIGLIAALREPRRWLPVLLMLCSGMALLVFPLKTRYFMPVFPLLALLAGAGLARLLEAAAERRFRTVGAAAAGALVFAMAFRFGPLDLPRPDVSEAHYAIAKGFAAAGRQEQAEAWFLSSLRRNPSNVSALNDLGALLAGQGRAPAALPYFRRAAELSPGDVMFRENYEGCLKAVRSAGR